MHHEDVILYEVLRTKNADFRCEQNHTAVILYDFFLKNDVFEGIRQIVYKPVYFGKHEFHPKCGYSNLEYVSYSYPNTP